MLTQKHTKKHFNSVIPGVQKLLRELVGMELVKMRPKEASSAKSESRCSLILSSRASPLDCACALLLPSRPLPSLTLIASSLSPDSPLLPPLAQTQQRPTSSARPSLSPSSAPPRNPSPPPSPMSPRPTNRTSLLPLLWLASLLRGKRMVRL